jgi:NAD(P)-dependent dehydrogenase (short-subunit alcohol dehydrogenase family)
MSLGQSDWYEKTAMDANTHKVVLITGAGRGLGRAVALAFSSQGAAVAANDINQLSLDETVEQIHHAGGYATAHVFDIAKRMPIEGMIAQVLEMYGRIDILINHASVEPDASILEMDEWEFQRTLDVNLGGPFFTLQQVGRVMRQQGGGAIVNLISTSDRRDIHKGHAAHLASQVGLIGLTQAAAREFSAFHIRVNAVCDGQQETGPIPSALWDITSFQRWQEAFPDLKLVDRPGLVSLVLFMCSSAASSLTGQVISLPIGM